MPDIDEPMGVGGADDAMVAAAAPVGAVAAFCDGAKSFVDMVWRLWDFGTEQHLENETTGEIALVHRSHFYGAKPVFEWGSIHLRICLWSTRVGWCRR